MSQVDAIDAGASRYRQTLQAIGWGVMGWTCFAFADIVTKWLTQTYSVSQILCITNLIGTIVTGMWIVFRHGKTGFRSQRMKWHMARGVCVVGSSVLVVNAVARVPLADFYGIVFLSPMAVALLSALVLGEKIGIHRLIAIIAGFGGVLVLAGPQFDDLNIGLVFAFCSVLFIATNSIIIRKIGREPVTMLFAFYPFVYSAVFNLPFMLGSYTPVASGDMILFLILPALALAGLIGFALGFSRAPETAVVAPFHYTQIIWGVMFGFFLFGDIPTPATLAGVVIIIAAGLYLIWREHLAHTRH